MSLENFEQQKRDAFARDLGSLIKSHPGIRAKIAGFSQLRPSISGAALILNWTLISAVVVLGLAMDSWALYPLSVLLIASRQHALLVLMHEGAHFRIHPNTKINDNLSDFLAAFPLLADTAGYRAHHWAHHRNLNSDKDPDWVRKSRLEEWRFPKTRGRMVLELGKNLYRGGVEWLGLAVHFSIRSRWAPKLGYLLVLAGMAAATGHLATVFFYWVIPLFTLFPWMQRVRSIAEHFGLEYKSELSQSRNVLAGWYESFFLGPHNVNHHLTHHLFPAVPFYNLPELTRALMQIEAFAEHAHQNSSYLVPGERSVFRDLTASGPGLGGQTEKAA